MGTFFPVSSWGTLSPTFGLGPSRPDAIGHAPRDADGPLTVNGKFKHAPRMRSLSKKWGIFFLFRRGGHFTHLLDSVRRAPTR